MRNNDDTKQAAASMARRLRGVVGEQAVERVARQTGLLQRKRKVSPLGLVVACLSTLGTGPVTWLADILRTFNKNSAAPVQYKPFHNQLRKKAFAEFVRRLLVEALTTLTQPVLQAVPEGKLARFRDIVLHDGTSLALKDTLAAQWPGRFTKISPAAVELHVTMNAFEDGPVAITLTADKEAERQFAPSADELEGCLLLQDRGYQSQQLFCEFKANDVSFIVRGTKNIRPVIRAARDHHGRRCRHLRRLYGKTLSWKFLPQGQHLDLDIEWPGANGRSYVGRLVVFYKRGKRNTKEFTYLHTNLDRAEFSATEVGQLYRLRWQIELLFKEWKSHANLHKFDTSMPAIAQAMLWASLIVAIIKRGLAHAAEQVLGIELSTERVAKAARHFLDDILGALSSAGRSLTRAVRDAFEFFRDNARRAHPERDRRTGRLAPGLRPIVCLTAAEGLTTNL
jgi:hypothetical protein